MTTIARRRRWRDERLRALALAAGDLARWHAQHAEGDEHSRGLAEAYDDVARVLGGLLELHADNDGRRQPLSGHEG